MLLALHVTPLTSYVVRAQHGWCLGTIKARAGDKEDMGEEDMETITFIASYDDDNDAKHALLASAYAWGPAAPWDSWCLLVEEHSGTGPREPPLVEGGAFTQWMRAFGEPDVRLQTMVERWLLLPQSEREALVQAAKGPMRGAREQPEGQNTRRPPDRRGGVRGRKRAFDGVPAPALLASIQRKYRCKDGAMCRCVAKGRVP